MIPDMIGLIVWANKIDNRFGPISGRDADDLAKFLREAAWRMDQLEDALAHALLNLEIVRGNPSAGPGGLLAK